MNAIKARKLWLALALVLAHVGAMAGDERDPWENMNRRIFAFNDAVDAAVVRPVAKAYDTVLPSFARTGVHNFLGNLSDVWSLANSALQLKPQATAETVMRVSVNTVFGLVGVLDIATELEKVALEDEYFIKRKLYPNVDFYSGIIYRALGIPRSMFTVMFAIARSAGWVAHWQEMIADPEMKIARPRQLYTGPTTRDYVPVKKR